jgi:hypothetical protein
MTTDYPTVTSVGTKHQPNKTQPEYTARTVEFAEQPVLTPTIEAPNKTVRTVQTDVLGSVHDGKRHQAPTPCDYKGTA